MAAWLPGEVRDAITDRIAALSVEGRAYAADADGWVRASYPLVPELEPADVAHLRFWVDDRTSQQGLTGQLYTLDGSGPTVRAPIVVRWLMQMRPLGDGLVASDTDAIVDWDRAGASAAHLAGWLLAPWHDFDLVALGSLWLAREPVASGAFVRCDLQLDVNYTLNIG